MIDLEIIQPPKIKSKSNLGNHFIIRVKLRINNEHQKHNQKKYYLLCAMEFYLYSKIKYLKFVNYITNAEDYKQIAEQKDDNYVPEVTFNEFLNKLKQLTRSKNPYRTSTSVITLSNEDFIKIFIKLLSLVDEEDMNTNSYYRMKKFLLDPKLIYALTS